MTVLTCLHGYFTHDCALCGKPVTTCDFGSCLDAPTVRVSTIAHGRAHEHRKMCARHAAKSSGAHSNLRDPLPCV